MLSWKKTIVTSVIVGAMLYGGLSYARIIPGVDEPFDPGNYYSLVSISWPDSAPSTFTLRDIAGSGGKVYDPWRDKEQQAKNKDVKGWLEAQIQQTLNKILEMTPWGKAVTGPIQEGIHALNENNLTTLPNDIAKAKEDPKLFATPSNPQGPGSDGSSPYSTRSDKIKYVRDKLEATANFVAKQSEAEKRSDELLRQALELAANAQGTLEAQQAENLINAVIASEWERRAEIISQMVAIKSLESMQQVDESVRAQQMNNASKLYMYDPYNPTKIDEESYKRPEPIGMLEFK